MKAKLIFDGREIEVEISDEQANALTEKPKKKTGYERVENGGIYYLEGNDGIIHCREGRFSDEHYECAIYYSDKTVAENNARADKLHRQLRRFAVEHRDEKIDWNDEEQRKYSIMFVHGNKSFDIWDSKRYQEFGQVSFDSEKTALLAIDTFKDELMWYFTEYRDSL